MEGFVQLRLRPIVRRLLTRAVAIVPAVITIVAFGEHATGDLLVLSQVVLSLQLSFAVIPLIHLVSDQRWMGQYAIKPLLRAAAWVVAGVIAALNLKLAFDEISGWLLGAGSHAWLLWITVVPAAAGLVGLLVYVTVKPALERWRGEPTPVLDGVHGPSAMPAVVPSDRTEAHRRGRRLLRRRHRGPLARGDAGAIRRARRQRAPAARGGVGRCPPDGRRDAGQRGTRRPGAPRALPQRARRAGRGGQLRPRLRRPGRRSSPRSSRATSPTCWCSAATATAGVGDFVHGTTVERLRHRIKVPVLVVPTAG